MVVSTDLENKCLTLLIWHRIEIRDEVRVLTCSLKVRLESNMNECNNELIIRILNSLVKFDPRIRLMGSVSEKSIHYCILEKTSWLKTY